MKPDYLKLLDGYLDGLLNAADFERLQTLLREDTDARRTLRSLATVDAKLQELAALNPATLELLSTAARSAKSAHSATSFWRRGRNKTIVRVVATASLAAMLLFVFFFRGHFNVLAAVAETQRIAELPTLRKYVVNLARDNDSGTKNDSPPLFQHGTLRSKGGNRFVFQSSSRAILPVEVRVNAGRDERGYWAYAEPFPRVMRAQDLPRLNEALPGFTLAYMELGPIIAAMIENFEIADLGADSRTKLRHLQGKLKADRRNAIRLLDFWIDADSEIVKLAAEVQSPVEGALCITFERETVDFQNDDVFKPTHYCPAGTPEVDVKAAPLRNLLEKRNQRKTSGENP